MRKRVDVTTVNTTTFKEEVEFNKETPHSIRIKHFKVDEIVALHYAPTIEILIATDVDGEITVGNNRRYFLPRDVVIIPPYSTHSTYCHQCPGELINIKISFEALKAFLNLPALLEWENGSIYGVIFAAQLYEPMMAVANRLIHEDDHIISRMHCMLDIMEMLLQVNREKKGEVSAALPPDDARLHQLIQWTYEHYSEHVTLEDAAQQVNMSKYHFCKFFKSIARVTYVTFLNQVRLEKATKLLKIGKNVTECASFCGFDSVSYFVQLFKRNLGCTPGQFVHSNEAATVINGNIPIESNKIPIDDLGTK